MKQLALQLPVTAHTTLISVDTARAVLGLDAQSVAALCESGELEYTFDLRRADAERREVRIWTESLLAYSRGIRVESDPESAIQSIIGHSLAEWIACSQLSLRFTVHRRSVVRWAEAHEVVGVLSGHTYQVQRASLIPVLMSRRIR